MLFNCQFLIVKKLLKTPEEAFNVSFLNKQVY